MTGLGQAEFLSTCGKLLYGDDWQAQLAEAIGVPVGEVEAWAAGKAIPAALWARIGELMRLRHQAILATLRSFPKQES